MAQGNKYYLEAIVASIWFEESGDQSNPLNCTIKLHACGDYTFRRNDKIYTLLVKQDEIKKDGRVVDNDIPFKEDPQRLSMIGVDQDVECKVTNERFNSILVELYRQSKKAGFIVKEHGISGEISMELCSIKMGL